MRGSHSLANCAGLKIRSLVVRGFESLPPHHRLQLDFTSFDDFSFLTMFFYDIRNVLFRVIYSVPDCFRIDHHCRSLFTKVQTTGFVCPHLSDQSLFNDFLFESQTYLCSTLLGTASTRMSTLSEVLTYEYVLLKADNGSTFRIFHNPSNHIW